MKKRDNNKYYVIFKIPTFPTFAHSQINGWATKDINKGGIISSAKKSLPLLTTSVCSNLFPIWFSNFEAPSLIVDALADVMKWRKNKVSNAFFLLNFHVECIFEIYEEKNLFLLLCIVEFVEKCHRKDKQTRLIFITKIILPHR